MKNAIETKQDELINVNDIMKNMINKFYNIECIVSAKNLKYVNMLPLYLHRRKFKKFYHVKLIQINGMYTGQLHFVNDTGKYLMLPWCYIVSMVPCDNK